MNGPGAGRRDDLREKSVLDRENGPALNDIYRPMWVGHWWKHHPDREDMERRAFLKRAGLLTAGGMTGVGSASAQRDTSLEVGMYTEDGEYYFDPVGLHVEPGETVTWINESGAHTTTSYSPENPSASVRRIPDGADPWHSQTFTESGATFEYTFEVEGTYEYYCVPHKTLGMVGRIICGEPGGIGEEEPIPDGTATGEVPSSDVIVEQGSVAYPYTAASAVGTNGVLRSVGLFGVIGVGAVAFYHLFNSSGEQTTVGSDGWRRENDLEDLDE